LKLLQVAKFLTYVNVLVVSKIQIKKTAQFEKSNGREENSIVLKTTQKNYETRNIVQHSVRDHPTPE
jgi:hypothetical protein